MMNLLTDDMRRNPYPVYDQIRGMSPVLEVPGTEMWMLFDYEGVKRALHDHEAFSSVVTSATGKAPDWLIFSDPPRHTKLRALLMRAFTPRSIAGLEPRIREVSRELLDPTIERGSMDLVADYADLLPTTVIAEMIGIPIADRPRFHRWVAAIMGLSYTISAGEEADRAVAAHAAAKKEMAAYLGVVLEERRRAPKDDLLTRLVEAEVDGERLTELEILDFFQLLLSAGTETTTNLISNAILCFIEHPGELARLRASPELLPSGAARARPGAPADPLRAGGAGLGAGLTSPAGRAAGHASLPHSNVLLEGPRVSRMWSYNLRPCIRGCGRVRSPRGPR